MIRSKINYLVFAIRSLSKPSSVFLWEIKRLRTTLSCLDYKIELKLNEVIFLLVFAGISSYQKTTHQCFFSKVDETTFFDPPFLLA